MMKIKPLLLCALLYALSRVAFAQTPAPAVLPQPEPEFRGKIAFTSEESTPDWPQPPKAPANAPNVVLILLDDVGFAASGTFGGPAQTPGLDQLAARGLRYNQFHTTALCTPTRAALLTGRNDHRAGFGTVMESVTGFPGYNGLWKKSTVSVAEVLRRNGYSTAAFGKWHNTPLWEISPVGPFDRWPTGLGFEYFYGFMAGATTQWDTPLYRNTTPVEPSRSPSQGYHFTADITDDAIRWVHTHQSLAPEKPYFLYFATGATHEPHHVPKEWIDKYLGRFDQGWDQLRAEIFARQKKLGVIPANAELTPRPREIPAWDSLSADQKKLYARQMEVYAAFLAHTDHEVQRLVRTVQEGPQGDNTLIIYIVGDNGASAEGGLAGRDVEPKNVSSTAAGLTPTPVAERLQYIDELGSELHLNQYSAGWAWATGAPFQWMKQVASHFGGTTDPVIVSWPARIKDFGGLRSQFTHVNAVAATLYEVIGIPFPHVVDGVEQLPLDGVSFAYTFDDAKAPSRHTLQIFEQMGSRAIYKDGWVAGARHAVPWDYVRNNDYASDRWELYHITEDYSQAHDLAARYPEKLKELRALFEVEARRNDIYPLGTGFGGKPFGTGQPRLAGERKEFVFYPGTPRIPASQAPEFGRSHRITATVSMPAAGADGALIADGGRVGGFVLYVKEGHLVYESNFHGRSRDLITSNVPVPTGKSELAFEFTQRGGGGTGRLYINGQLVGEKPIAHFSPPTFTSESDSFSIGQALGSPVSNAYQPPFAFGGTLEKLKVEFP